jgi:hypothetical protein
LNGQRSVHPSRMDDRVVIGPCGTGVGTLGVRRWGSATASHAATAIPRTARGQANRSIVHVSGPADDLLCVCVCGVCQYTRSTKCIAIVNPLSRDKAQETVPSFRGRTALRVRGGADGD